eukprot:4850074-Lingulodinium_polyedra.AAC.1
MAVRRHYNKAADALATAGCIRAARLAAAGVREPAVWEGHIIYATGARACPGSALRACPGL